MKNTWTWKFTGKISWNLSVRESGNPVIEDVFRSSIPVMAPRHKNCEIRGNYCEKKETKAFFDRRAAAYS